MKATLGFFFWFCLLGLSYCQGKDKPVSQNLISYTIQPTLSGTQQALRVDVKVAIPKGSTQFDFTYLNNSWGQNDLYRCLDTIISAHRKLIAVKMPAENKISFQGKLPAELKFSYQIKQDFEGEIKHENSYRPLIQTGFFHLFGHSLFMVPSSFQAEGKPFDMSVKWEGFPDNYAIHNSFGSQQRQQRFTIQNWGEGTVFVGGDFRLNAFKVQGKSVVLAMRGQWPLFSDEQLKNNLEKTVQTQRAFWNDYSQEYFTVVMLPIYGQCEKIGNRFSGMISVGGTALVNSFSTFCTNNVCTDLSQFDYLYNHELMHNWLGHTIHTMGEEEYYWLREGFTDYFCYQSLLKNGFFSPEKYLAEVNGRVFKPHYTNRAREKPNSEINYNNFWSDPDFEKLPYRRGMIYAYYLDGKIKQASNGQSSLRNLMLDMLQMAKKGKVIDTVDFLELAKKYCGADQSESFKTYILEGKLLQPEDFVLPPGLSIAWSEDKTFLKLSKAPTANDSTWETLTQ
jgi:predicted metalloprotease with PDZ domain